MKKQNRWFSLKIMIKKDRVKRGLMAKRYFRIYMIFIAKERKNLKIFNRNKIIKT
jgi:hypothetical protein